MLLDLIMRRLSSDSKKVELLVGNCAQTREIEKLNLGIDLGTEATLPYRVRTQGTKEIYPAEIWPIGFTKVKL